MEIPWREYVRPLPEPEGIPWDVVLSLAPLRNVVPGYPQAPIERIVLVELK